MNLAALAFLNRWWIRQLVNALLRPMFIRYRTAQAEGNEAAARRFLRLFDRLLFTCDCYPFCIEVDRCGLWILDEPSERDSFWEDEM